MFLGKREGVMKLIRNGLAVILVLFLIWPFVKELVWQKSNLNFIGAKSVIGDYYKAMRFDSPIYRALAWVRANTQREDKFFVMRQSDFANYAGRPFLYALDPKALPVYEAATVLELKKVLSSLGIRYFLLPSYDQPFYYRTSLMDLLSDPSSAELLYYDKGVKILKLLDASAGQVRKPKKERVLSLAETDWACTTGRGERCRGTIESVPEGIRLQAPGGAKVNHITNLIYGLGAAYVAPDNMGMDFHLDGAVDYEFTAVLEGQGKLHLSMATFNKAHFLGLKILWNGVLHPGEPQTIKGQFRFSNLVDSGKPLFRILGEGNVTVKSLVFKEYDAVKKKSINRFKAISKSWDMLVTGSRKAMAYWGVQSDEDETYLRSAVFPSAIRQLLISPTFSLNAKKMSFRLEAQGCGQLVAYVFNHKKELFKIGDFNFPKGTSLSTQSFFELEKSMDDYLKPYQLLKKSLKNFVLPFGLENHISEVKVGEGFGRLLVAHKFGFDKVGRRCDPSIIKIKKLSLEDDCGQSSCSKLLDQSF